MSNNDTSEEEEQDTSTSTRIFCLVCRCPFIKMAHHIRFSPQCAPAPGRETTSLVLPSPPSSRPHDLLSEIPKQQDVAGSTSLLDSDSDPGCPQEGTDNDLDDDDYQMVFNTESYFISNTSGTRTSPANNTGQSLAASSGSTPPAIQSPVTGTAQLATPGVQEPVPQTASLESGLEFTVPSDFGKSNHCFTKSDRSMMRLYNICDKATCPRYLFDSLLAQLKTEMTRNNFDPLASSLTRRDPFMARMHRKFPSPPPEAILVQLECLAEPITMYQFDGILQLQHHLLRKDLYGDLSRLNVNQTDPFDQSLPLPLSGMREITEGTWHRRALSRNNPGPAAGAAPDDLQELLAEEDRSEDKYRKFMLTLEEYKDSTGSDSKEAFSLEPILMSTGLLDSSFNSDPSSRFILGYIPNLSNMKSSASQTRRAGTQKGYGSSVRDYHKCLSILLQPFVEAQTNPPLLDLLLGNKLCRCRTVLLMGTLLGDGKSHDLSCGRVGAQTNTLRLSRAVLIPSDIADDTTQPFHWIKSRVIEAVARAALFDPELGRQAQPYDDTIEYNRYLRALRLHGERLKQVAGAKRRVRIATAILNKALGSHKVSNAYFALDFASDYGVFGHTLADLMHLLEEGILKYTLGVFLEALSATAQSDLDDLVSKLFSAKANRCHGSRLFPRLNFTRGYSRLTLLSSEERTGAFLALIVVLVTEKGKDILLHRFSDGFDDRRKARAERFKGKKKQRRGEVANSNIDDDASSEGEMPPAEEEEEEIAEPLANIIRTKEFVPCRDTIGYVCRQIRRHDLNFLFTEVFPEIPDRHIFECLKIIWESTYRLSDDLGKVTQLPPNILNIPPFRKRKISDEDDTHNLYDAEKLKTVFSGYRDPSSDPLLREAIPSITNSPTQFIDCCEQLLSLRSFFNYSGEHCPGAVPLRENGTLNLGLVQSRTRQVGQSLKEAVNRGDGTNQWRIPKFLDMLLLPEYMDHLASTGRYHVGFCERGLKTWAKFPANTSQKRGNGVFEGQCAARMRENSMVDYALTQMESDAESDAEELAGKEDGICGACFHIAIVAEVPTARRKVITSTRLNAAKKPHSLQFPLPASILAFFKSSGHIGEEYEYRTEAVVGGVTYRAHPNFQGAGPWYDFSMVRFDHAPLDRTHVDDNNTYPAKIIGFFRLLPDRTDPLAEVDDQDSDFSVLVHSGAFQKRNSPIHQIRTLLTRSWLYEVQGGLHPLPAYRVAGTLKSNFVLGEHILGVEEVPGFHERYHTEEHRRFIVLSDMRKHWPRVFINGPRDR